jgi:hypothetical protein
MKIYSDTEAWKNLSQGHSNQLSYIPAKTGPNYNTQYDGIGVIPNFIEKFKFDKNDQIFTIGSCFAREIESHLYHTGFNMLYTKFTPSIQSFRQHEQGEYPILPTSHLINEYNVGAIVQRIENAFNIFQYDVNAGVQEHGEFYKDMFLHGDSFPVTITQLIQRRKEVEQFYKELTNADIVIITFGLIECWYDNKYNVFLNKTPSYDHVKLHPGRYDFHRLTYDEVIQKIERIITLLTTFGKPNVKILFTVSPVQLDATFTKQNCILATSYSKAILRSAVGSICDNYSFVDYFPSYEIVTSRGCNGGYADDNVHILPEAVNAVVTHLLSKYVK